MTLLLLQWLPAARNTDPATMPPAHPCPKLGTTSRDHQRPFVPQTKGEWCWLWGSHLQPLQLLGWTECLRLQRESSTAQSRSLDRELHLKGTSCITNSLTSVPHWEHAEYSRAEEPPQATITTAEACGPAQGHTGATITPPCPLLPLPWAPETSRSDQKGKRQALGSPKQGRQNPSWKPHKRTSGQELKEAEKNSPEFLD